MNPKHFGDGRPRDVRVQDCRLIALVLGQYRQHGGGEGFSDVSLTADHTNHLFDRGIFAQRFDHALGSSPLTAFTAALGAVM